MVARRPRPPSQPRGRHYLRSRALAEDLVRRARISADDLVFEIGAGGGLLTQALADRGARVLAVETDPRAVKGLTHRFHDSETVRVMPGDACKVALPQEPFRAFGNIPFHITTALLRRLLDDPGSPLERADLVLPRGVARKRGRARGNLLAVSWAPWWEFRILRGLPGACFRPAPDVAAAFVAITRRNPSLLGLDDRRGFRTLVSRGFNRANLPVRRFLKGEMPARRLKQALREAGAPPDARPTDLSAQEWITIYRFWRSQ